MDSAIKLLNNWCLSFITMYVACTCSQCQFCLCSGIKESDTGLAPPALWDLAADKQTLQGEQPLQVFNIINTY